VLQEKKGFVFESETDTETIAKLMKHIHSTNPKLSFRELVENVIEQLVSGLWSFHLCNSSVPSSVGHCLPQLLTYVGFFCRKGRLPWPARATTTPMKLWSQGVYFCRSLFSDKVECQQL
jgi:hypothetical protein